MARTRFLSTGIFFLMLLLLLAACSLTRAVSAQESPVFEPAPAEGAIPANVLIVKPQGFKEKTLKAGDYLVWNAEKKEGESPDRWSWQKNGPFSLKGGTRYKVTTTTRNKLFMRPLNDENRQPPAPGDAALEFDNSWLLTMAFVVAQAQGGGASAATAAPDPVASKPGAWDGTVSGIYDCGIGKMKISQKGKIVSGAYDWSGGGTICGSMEGNVLTGTFADKYGNGEIKYTFDAKGFINNWRFAGEYVWRDMPRAKKIP